MEYNVPTEDVKPDKLTVDGYYNEDAHSIKVAFLTIEKLKIDFGKKASFEGSKLKSSKSVIRMKGIIHFKMTASK